MSHRTFHPSRRLLLGAGPSPVSDRVLGRMAQPVLGHLDPEFGRVMNELQELLRDAFRTANPLTLVLSGPGTAGMEAALANLLQPGDRTVVCRNGYFGGRLTEMARRLGAEVSTLDFPWGEAVDPEALDRLLAAEPGVKLVAFVHAETSGGALSAAAAIAGTARRHGALTLMDAVTSLGGVPVETDAWGIDAVYAGSQKCLSAPPGLSPVTFGPRAVEAMRARRSPGSSWLLDLDLLAGYWNASGKRSYHHTAPANLYYALHEALVVLEEEGLEAAWARHRLCHRAFAAGLEVLGLELHPAPAVRLPQLNAVRVPEGVDEAAVRAALLRDHGIEISGGLGELAGRIWRIGLMGRGARREPVIACLEALAAVLPGASGSGRAATEAARRVLDAPSG